MYRRRVTMKINNNFVLQEVADEFIVVPVGEAADKLSGVIRLNKTGAFIWKKLEEANLEEDELVQVLSTEYPADINKIREDVESFIQQLSDWGCLL